MPKSPGINAQIALTRAYAHARPCARPHMRSRKQFFRHHTGTFVILVPGPQQFQRLIKSRYAFPGMHPVRNPAQNRR